MTRRFHLWMLGGTVLGGAALLALTLPAKAQQAAPSVQIYAGAPAAAEGLRLGGWGSGMAIEDRTYKSSGDLSIKLETNGYYAGGRIVFEAPKNITAQKNDPAGLLEFVTRFQQGRPKPMLGPGGQFPGDSSGGVSGSGGGFFSGSDSSGAGVSGDSGAGFPGGPAAGGFPGAGFPGDGQTLNPDTKKVKVVLICDEGTFVATNFPVTMVPSTEENWYSVAIPFVAFKGLDKAKSVNVREIRIFGDNRDTFWIGEIRTTSDDEPIVVDALDALDVSVGEGVEFVATATGGIAPLHYSWDFDQSDGIQEDAVGQRVIHVFRKPSPPFPNNSRPGEVQPYLVTLTVSDIGGAKRPVRKTFDVTVNP